MKTKHWIICIAYFGALLGIGIYHHIDFTQKEHVFRADTITITTDSLLADAATLLGSFKGTDITLDEEWEEGQNGTLELNNLFPTTDGEEGLYEQLRIRLFSDFIHRFNGDSTALAALKGRVNYSGHGIEDVRTGIILSLCDSPDVLKSPELNTFARYIVEKGLFINTDNYAAVCTLAYKDHLSHLFPVRLTFRPEWIRDSVEVWQIKQAESPYFDLIPNTKDYYIDPAEKEVGFMGMQDASGATPQSLGGQEFRMDPLSLFLFLNGKRYITYAGSLGTCFIVELGEYRFAVTYLNSGRHARSGWIITKIAHRGQLIFLHKQ